MRAFGQEAIAGVDGVAAMLQRRTDQQLGAQIALRGGRRANDHALVGQAGGQAVAVGFGHRRHRFDTQGLAGSHDAYGDFATVGDQDPTNVAGCHGNAAHQRASGSIIIKIWSR
ncbi:hypothetical protein D3C73_1058360 [compost metagenome]